MLEEFQLSRQLGRIVGAQSCGCVQVAIRSIAGRSVFSLGSEASCVSSRFLPGFTLYADILDSNRRIIKVLIFSVYRIMISPITRLISTSSLFSAVS